MNKQKYFWQGEPVKTDFGVVVQPENKEKPLYWYNFECNWNVAENKPRYGTVKTCSIPAIKVTTKDGQVFLIANHFGIGANKLMKGGSPRDTHFSFGDNAKFQGAEDLGVFRNAYSIRKFDEDGFVEYEAKRERWQKENFPEEFERMENLRKSFKRP